MKEGRAFRAPAHQAVFNGARVAVGKIVCVGKNYAEHIREMEGKSHADPVFFLKPSTALVSGRGLRITVPMGFGELHHEVELAVLIGDRARAADPGEALGLVAGYAVALDLTLRDVQARAKKSGGPWSLAKGFDASAPVGDFVPRESVADPHDLEIRLDVNGQTRQKARTSAMIHRVEDLVAYISRYMTLEPGDILLTGTPEGVGPLSDGDRIRAGIAGLPSLEVEITRPQEGIIEARRE